MKKITAMLAALVLILTAVRVSAAPAVSARIKLGGGTGVFATEITAALTEEGLAMKWDILENTVLLLKLEPEEGGIPEGLLPPAEISEDTRKTLTETAQAWARQRLVSTKKGIFSGDAFSIARKEDTYIFSASDFLALVKAAGKAAPEIGMWTSLAEEGLEEAAFSGGTEGTLKVYDDGKYYSLTMKQQGNTVFTASVNANDPGELLAVAGHSENGKNYYHRIRLTLEGKKVNIETELLADDEGSGFAALGDRNRVLTDTAAITNDDDGSYTIQYTSAPADGSDALTVTAVVDVTDDPDPVPEGYTVIDLDAESETELDEKMGAFTEKLPQLMIQLMTAVPMSFLDLVFEE